MLDKPGTQIVDRLLIDINTAPVTNTVSTSFFGANALPDLGYFGKHLIHDIGDDSSHLETGIDIVYSKISVKASNKGV